MLIGIVVGSLGAGAGYSYRVSQLARTGGGTCGMDGLLSLDREIVAVGTPAA